MVLEGGSHFLSSFYNSPPSLAARPGLETFPLDFKPSEKERNMKFSEIYEFISERFPCPESRNQNGLQGGTFGSISQDWD